jgi:hypothetical protein
MITPNPSFVLRMKLSVGILPQLSLILKFCRVDLQTGYAYNGLRLIFLQ